MEYLPWFLIGAGGLSICGAVFDWDWFMNSRKKRFVMARLGRGGARVFYAILGAGIVVFGVMALLGLVDMQS